MQKFNRLKPNANAHPSSEGGGRLRNGFLGFLFLPFYLTWVGAKLFFQWVWHAPKLIQLLLAVLVILTVLGSGFVLYRMNKNAKFSSVFQYWTEFSTAASSNDREGMLKAINSILAAKANESLALSRLEALKTGIADVNDSPMCLITTRIHLKNDHFPDAIREAKKRLVNEPEDWLCNLLLAKDAINRNDKDKARDFLNLCSNAEKTKPPLGLVLFAIELRESIQLDVGDLRGYIFLRVLPNLRNQNLSQIKPDGKIQVIFSYASSVATISETNLANTLQYWAYMTQMADQTIQEAVEEKNENVLKQMATLQTLLNYSVSRFRKEGLILPDEANGLSKECDNRAETAWRALMKIAPKNADSYAGVASYLIKANKYPEAEAILKSGIENAGPYPQILQLYVKTATQRNQPEEALQLAVEVAQKNPTLPETWQVVVEAAIAAKRRDVAIKACENARKSKTDLPWVDAIEASLWLEYGDPHKALQLLTKIPESTRSTAPFIAKLYAKALSQSGSDVLIPDFIRLTINEAEKKNRPDLARAVLLGLSEAKLNSTRADYLAEQLDRIVTHWTSHPEIQTEGRWDLADAIFHSAELSEPRWETTRLERCIRAYQALNKQFPEDPRSLTRLSILYLYGRKKPTDALEMVDELRKLPNLKAANYEVIGAVLVANQKYDDALNLLEMVCRSSNASGFAYTQLALTHYYRGDKTLAKRAMIQANVLHKSAWESELYRAAASKLLQE